MMAAQPTLRYHVQDAPALVVARLGANDARKSAARSGRHTSAQTMVAQYVQMMREADTVACDKRCARMYTHSSDFHINVRDVRVSSVRPLAQGVGIRVPPEDMRNDIPTWYGTTLCPSRFVCDSCARVMRIFSEASQSCRAISWGVQQSIRTRSEHTSRKRTTNSSGQCDARDHTEQDYRIFRMFAFSPHKSTRADTRN